MIIPMSSPMYLECSQEEKIIFERQARGIPPIVNAFNENLNPFNYPIFIIIKDRSGTIWEISYYDSVNLSRSVSPIWKRVKDPQILMRSNFKFMHSSKVFGTPNATLIDPLGFSKFVYFSSNLFGTTMHPNDSPYIYQQYFCALGG